MSMVESSNAVKIESQPAGVGGWFKSALVRLFESAGVPPTAALGRTSDTGTDDAQTRGEFIVSAGGYRIRVPRESDLAHSVGDLLPAVRDGLALLPPLPTVVVELLREIEDPKSSAVTVAEVAAYDPALAASMLRAANGAALGFSRAITSISEAISYLGYATVKSMVIRLRLNEVLTCKNVQAALDSDDLWVHSLAVSHVSEYLAKKIGGVDPGFVATLGLLHDIGKLAVLAKLPEEADTIRSEESDASIDRLALEARVLGMDHAGLGANLAAKWKLPADLIQGIRSHHAPADAFHATDPVQFRRAVHIMQLANQLVKYCYPHSDHMDIDEISPEVFAFLGLEPSLPKLLDRGVRDAIGRAIYFATGNSRRPISPNRRFLRPVGEEDVRAMFSSPGSSHNRISIDEALVSSVFSSAARGSLHGQFSAGPAPEENARLVSDVLAHQQSLSLPEQLKSPAATTVKCFIPNLMPLLLPDESIEVSQSFIDGRYVLAIRTPGLAAWRRFGRRVDADGPLRLAEADMANLLNLAWFDRIAINADGSAVVFVR